MALPARTPLAVRVLLAALLLAAGPAGAQTRVTFGTNWLAEAEHGGFYQALALGFYRRHGLDVTIRQGGPAVNPSLLVAAGITDLQMSPNSFGALNLVREHVPVFAVAAFFQKDPDALIAHPGAGNDTLAAMRGKPIMISATARDGFWQFLRARFGFTDDQIRPYNYSVVPFLADQTAIQQGYVTAEPLQIERRTGEIPVVTLLADNGYASHANLVLVTRKLAAERPETVQAFVDASIEGWQSYLRDDPAPADALIRTANPEMTQDTIDRSRAAIGQHGLAGPGSDLGAMTRARWKSFFDTMVSVGIYPPGMDWEQAFTLAFVQPHGGPAAGLK